MNENTSSNKAYGSENQTHTTEGHAQWQLEKDTEGLDNSSKSATSDSETAHSETAGSEEEKESSSSGCGCKYF